MPPTFPTVSGRRIGMESAILLLVFLAIMGLVLFLSVVHPLLEETKKFRATTTAIVRNNAIQLQDFLAHHEHFVEGVIIFTDGTYQNQIVGRVTDISLIQDGENRHLNISTDIPFNMESKREKEEGKHFHSWDTTLYCVQRSSDYYFSLNEEHGVFNIVYGYNHRLVTLVTKEKSELFIVDRKKFCDEYGQNSFEL